MQLTRSDFACNIRSFGEKFLGLDTTTARTLALLIILFNISCSAGDAVQETTSKDSQLEVTKNIQVSAIAPLVDLASSRNNFNLRPIDCSPTNCGGNSPVVNGFPINGIDPDGKINYQSIGLIKNSLESTLHPECNGQRLALDPDGYLVAGKDCSGEKLEGAKFAVRKDSSTQWIEIKSLWFHVTKRGRNLVGYIFTRPGKKRSLCDREEAQQFLSDLNITPYTPYGPIRDPLEKGVQWSSTESLANSRFMQLMSHEKPRLFQDKLLRSGQRIKEKPLLLQDNLLTSLELVKNEDVALAFVGKLYMNDSNPSEDDVDWINFACARDSLAKLDIYDIAPSTKENGLSVISHRDKRTAGLRMLTANYCGKADRYTTGEVEIRWWWPTLDQSKPSSPLEAVWDADGARCLSHSRLFESPRILSPNVLPSGCRPPKRCTTEKQVIENIRLECPNRRLKECTAQDEQEGLVASYLNKP